MIPSAIGGNWIEGSFTPMVSVTVTCTAQIRSDRDSTRSGTMGLWPLDFSSLQAPSQGAHRYRSTRLRLRNAQSRVPLFPNFRGSIVMHVSGRASEKKVGSSLLGNAVVSSAQQIHNQPSPHHGTYNASVLVSDKDTAAPRPSSSPKTLFAVRPPFEPPSRAQLRFDPIRRPSRGCRRG